MRYLLAIALVSAGIVAGVVAEADRRYHERQRSLPIALVIPEPLPKCADIDFAAADFVWFAAVARMEGHTAEAVMWEKVVDEEKARPCSGPRWEGPEQ